MDDDILKEAREAFDRAAEREADNRRAALDDLRFARLGEQWPAETLRERQRDGRPCLTINRLPAFIRQVVNDARQNAPAITVHPADSRSDPATAQVINGLIRSIENASDADVAYDTALESAVTSGLGYFRIGMEWALDDGFDKDLAIQRIANPFSVYGDPDSTAADSSDWMSAFIVERMARTAFERRFKGAEAVDWTGDYAGLGGAWLDEDQVMVAEYWTREAVERPIVALSNGETMELALFEARRDLFAAAGIGMVGQPRPARSFQVTQHLLTGAEVLETTPWAGKYIPIIPVFGDEVNVEGVRHFRSLVRDAKDPQTMFNYWRTISTELVALAPRAPFIGPKGAFDSDAEKWRSANTDAHAYIEFDGPMPPQRQGLPGVPSGVLQEALNASDDMKAIIGLYDASLGARSNETSGRAILARQREGDVSTFHFIDNLSRAIRHAGRVLIDLIPKVYDSARIVRILGPDGVSDSVPVNQPFSRDGIERLHDLTVGRYDLTVRAGPSYTSQREEAAGQMLELIRAFPQAAQVMGDLLAQNLDWPGADQIAERLKALLPAALKGEPPPLPPQGQRSGDPGADRKLAVDEFRARTEAYRAETERMQAMRGQAPAA